MRALTRHYEAALHWALAHTRLIAVASLLILGGSVIIYGQLGSSFLPELDERAFVLDYIMPPGTSLQESDRVLRQLEQFLQETPEVESYSRRAGARLALAITEPNAGDFLVKLRRERKRSLVRERRDCDRRKHENIVLCSLFGSSHLVGPYPVAGN